jgi:hypothetical protein
VLRNTICNDVFAAEFDYNSDDLSQNDIRLRAQPQASSYNREARSAFLAAAGGPEGPRPQRHSFGFAFTAEICTLPESSLNGIKRQRMRVEVRAQFSFGAPTGDKLQSLVFLYVPIGF